MPLRCQTTQGLSLEVYVIPLDVVEHPGLEHEERSVDPPLSGFRLFGERYDSPTVQLQGSEPSPRPDRGQSGESSVRLMKLEQRPQIDVRDSIDSSRVMVLPMSRSGDSFPDTIISSMSP